MKYLSFLLLPLFLISCGNQTEKGEGADSTLCDTTVVEYSDSSEYAIVKIDGSLPLGVDSVTTAIRDTVLHLLAESMSQVTWEENEVKPEPFGGEANDIQGFIRYYGKSIFHKYEKAAEADNKSRQEAYENDTTLNDTIRESMLADLPVWEYQVHFSTIEKNDFYWVLDGSGYCYQGGAHGGVIGLGSLTFDMKTGKRIRQWFILGAEAKMQKLLTDGLVSYFRESGDKGVNARNLKDNLLIMGDEIPLPQEICPYPQDGELHFVYGQYEVAPYAAGMPGFTVPFEKLKPYLTDEAKSLLSIK